MIDSMHYYFTVPVYIIIAFGVISIHLSKHETYYLSSVNVFGFRLSYLCLTLRYLPVSWDFTIDSPLKYLEHLIFFISIVVQHYSPFVSYFNFGLHSVSNVPAYVKFVFCMFFSICDSFSFIWHIYISVKFA